MSNASEFDYTTGEERMVCDARQKYYTMLKVEARDTREKISRRNGGRYRSVGYIAYGSMPSIFEWYVTTPILLWWWRTSQRFGRVIPSDA